MKKLLLLTALLILTTLNPTHLVSGEEAAISANRLSPNTEDCGDNEWLLDGCEFCGSDAYSVTHHADMDHDCDVGFIDSAMFAVAFENGDISADLSGDDEVTPEDAILFSNSYYDPGFIENCEECGVLPVGCAGTLRVNFSSDPTVDVDQIQEPLDEYNFVYIVAQGCRNLGAYSFDLEAQGVTLLGDPNACELRNTGEGFDLGPRVILQTPFTVNNPGSGDPAWIKIVPCSPSASISGLAWASADPPQELDFALVAHGGINAPPPADDGCDPTSAYCGSQIWTNDPCEFCGADAYSATGHTDMNHDCEVGFIDVAMFAVAEITQDTSGDFNRDGDVGLEDVNTFNSSLYDSDPNPIPNCTPCGIEPVGCAGTLRVSFSSNAADDTDYIPYPPGGNGAVYIVAEGCQNMGAYSYQLEADGLTLFGDASQCPVGSIGAEFGSGAQIVEELFYVMDDPSPNGEAWIKIIPCDANDYMGSSGLAWASADPAQEFQFSTVAHGGINMLPPADDGCFDCNNNGLEDAQETTMQLSFCIYGNSSGADWDWGIQGPSGMGFSYIINNEPGLPFNADGVAFATAFVNGINTKTCGSIHAEQWAYPGDNCFTVSVPGAQGFEFGVLQLNGFWGWLAGNGGLLSADFNPTINLVSTTNVPEIKNFYVTCYPNPFNPTTQIACELPKDAHLTIKIFNTRGELVKTLIDEMVQGGINKVSWNGTDTNGSKVAAGVYFYQASALGETMKGKIALVK